MSTRSDVGLAIKTEAYRGLPTNVRAFLTSGFFETTLSDGDGGGEDESMLFHSAGCKWDRHGSPISDLYTALLKLDHDDFVILEGCHDYPEHDENCWGTFEDNPWDLSRDISVSVSFHFAD